MPDASPNSPEARVVRVVRRLLAERSLSEAIAAHDDLRLAGLTSLDMVSLVLSVEAEFELLVPEDSIQPAHFRSVASISSLVTSLLKSA